MQALGYTLATFGRCLGGDRLIDDMVITPQNSKLISYKGTIKKNIILTLMTLPETGFSGGYLREILPRNFMISTCETGKRKRAPPDIGHAFLVFPPNKVPPPENERMEPVEKGTGIPKRSESSIIFR